VVACSVLSMDGGTDEPTQEQRHDSVPVSEPDEHAVSAPESGATSADSHVTSRAAVMDVRDEGEAALAARAAARRAREAADADSLAGDPYVHDALERLHAAITDLAGTRWAARGPDVLVAALRAVTVEQARLDAAALRLIGDVDGRDDVVPRAKPKTAGASLLRTALGMERRRAAREADLARLATGTNPDLAEIGAAYAAGEISRGHLEIAAGVHRRLGAFVREQPMGVADTDTGDVSERRTIEAVDGTLAARARDFTVTELARIGDRLVETLNPPSPDGAHRRRFLHLS